MRIQDHRLRSMARSYFKGALAEELAGSEIIESAAASDGVYPESAATLWIADRFFSELGTGHLRGLPAVTWNGMDDFIFVPNPNVPFSYTTSAGLGRRVIQPNLMPTDGGTVPRILRGLSNFSSWGYAPAYIIHDWIFQAKKLRITPDHDITFEQSAKILAEILKTMMVDGFTDYDGHRQKLEKAEDTLFLIYKAVSSMIARKLWDDDSTVRAVE